MSGQPRSIIIGWKRSWMLSSPAPLFYKRENSGQKNGAQQLKLRGKNIPGRKNNLNKNMCSGTTF